jgi:hypothetical protein
VAACRAVTGCETAPAALVKATALTTAAAVAAVISADVDRAHLDIRMLLIQWLFQARPGRDVWLGQGIWSDARRENGVTN